MIESFLPDHLRDVCDRIRETYADHMRLLMALHVPIMVIFFAFGDVLQMGIKALLLSASKEGSSMLMRAHQATTEFLRLLQEFADDLVKELAESAAEHDKPANVSDKSVN